jgi:polyketide synthase PksN
MSIYAAWALQKINHNLEHRAAIIASSDRELLENLNLLQKAGRSMLGTMLAAGKVGEKLG